MRSVEQPVHEIRILVADDEPAIRRTYKRALEDESGDKSNRGDDFETLSREVFGDTPADRAKPNLLPPGSLTLCSQASEAVDAVREAVETGRRYSMAFLDVRMPPGKDGIWAAEQLRLMDPDIQIVIVTGYSDIEPAQIAERVPPIDRLLYLQKPLHIHEMRHLVATLSSRSIAETSWRNLNQELAETVERRTSELLQVNQELEQARRLESVGRLASGLAHEINNPLGVILGFAQGMEKRVREDDPLHPPLASIIREVWRCQRLIQELLTFARTSRRDRESLDINELVEAVATLLEPRARAQGVSLHRDLAEDLAAVRGNRGQLQQVVLNLATNALDATPAGGLVALHTLPSGVDAICLEVADTGSGVPIDIRQQIFEPFFSTKEAGQGAGLGLSLVHEILYQHGGSIAVDDRDGGGAVMRVHLPHSLPPKGEEHRRDGDREEDPD